MMLLRLDQPFQSFSQITKKGEEARTIVQREERRNPFNPQGLELDPKQQEKWLEAAKDLALRTADRKGFYNQLEG